MSDDIPPGRLPATIERMIIVVAPKREHRIGILIAAALGMMIGMVVVLHHETYSYSSYYPWWACANPGYTYNCLPAGGRQFVVALLWGSFDAVIGAALAVIIRLLRF
jgi:hypothetical protein